MSNPHRPHDDPQRPDPFIDISWSGKIRKEKRRRSAHDYQATLESQRQHRPGLVQAPPQHSPTQTKHPYRSATPGEGAISDRPRPLPRQPEQWASRPNVKHEWTSVLWGLVVAIVIFGLVIAGFEMRRTDRLPASEKADETEQSQEVDDSEFPAIENMREETFDENIERAKSADETQTVDDWDVTIEKVTFDMDEFFTENQYSDWPFEDNVAVIVRAENLGSATRDFTSSIGISDPEHEFRFDGLCPEQPKHRISVYDVAAGDEILFSTCIPATADDLDGATLWAGVSYADENRVSWELPDDLLDELGDELDTDVDEAKK